MFGEEGISAEKRSAIEPRKGEFLEETILRVIVAPSQVENLSASICHKLTVGS